jgi:hypothetical protein
MSHPETSISLVDDVRQANGLFLNFLRSKPAVATLNFGLSAEAVRLLCEASVGQIDAAANFPRALFRLRVPSVAGVKFDPLKFAREPERRVLHVALLQMAWNLCRASGYAARLLLRLDDHAIRTLRGAELSEILSMAVADHVVGAAFDELDWIWCELLGESQPERRRWLNLLGLQPDFLPAGASGTA